MIEIKFLVSENDMDDYVSASRDKCIRIENRVFGEAMGAYLAQKNKIQVGDWVYQNTTKNIWKNTGIRDSYPVEVYTKLSQPLQELLNKEID